MRIQKYLLTAIALVFVFMGSIIFKTTPHANKLNLSLNSNLTSNSNRNTPPNPSETGKIPLVAIANYGPHSSLDATIEGIKRGLKDRGYIENKNIRFEESHVSFDSSLIPQMIAQLKSRQPDILIALATPVAQYAKGSIKDIPVVFSAITSPLEATLITTENKSDKNITGSSDRQNILEVLKFAQKIIPGSKRVGILYATSEANDTALVKMMQASALELNMQVVAIPIDEVRDIPLRMQHFRDKVDFIYVGTSGPIQPSLPVIAIEADKMHIPIINVNETAVQEGLVLASFGVNYYKVGDNAASIVDSLLRGEYIENVAPIYPKASDHQGYISHTRMRESGQSIPNDLINTTIVEDL